MTAMSEKNLSIGHLAQSAMTRVQTIRYYETIGLMPEAVRTAGNQRVYSDKDLKRLSFIRHARDLGFSLNAIRSLLMMSDEPEQSCVEADKLAREHLADVESRIERLQALQKELQRMIQQCQGGISAECRILGVLFDHKLCRYH